ncbi:hypothetical protein INT80_00800 [Gallibacterium anatis]|uniref:Uncharacterized protein n=1 Tax=Gallibacterium anatis TaxID=750 RepID=A0A930UQM2_9PAST|nr:hypothetical protein [Gallibacterium anatis]
MTTTLEHRDPAKILIAGDLRLNGENLVNDVSQIHVGNRIRMGGLFLIRMRKLNLKGNGVRLENKDLIGEIHRHDEGVWYTMVTKRKRHGIGKKFGLNMAMMINLLVEISLLNTLNSNWLIIRLGKLFNQQERRFVSKLSHNKLH